jgi:uncharacterized protein (TIRG00374 family)
MKKRIFSGFKYILFLGIGFFLICWQFKNMSTLQRSEFSKSLREANYWLLIPVIVFALLSHISRAIRWKILIEPMGYKPLTSTTFYSVMTGYLVNAFVPRAGEIVRCTLLSRYEKIPADKLIGSVVVERIFDLFCYFIIIGITVLIQIDLVGSFVLKKISQMAYENYARAIWVLLLIVIVICITVLFFKWMFKTYAGHKFTIKLKNFYAGIKEGLITIVKLKKRGWFIFHSVFIWLMYLLQIYIGFFALNATSHLGIPEAFSVLSLATLAIIVAPGGLGAFPLAVQEVLLIYNVDNISFGWMIWGVPTAVIIIGGLISFGLLIRKNKYLNEAK